MKILIEIRKGVIYSISASDFCEVAVIDWDNLDVGKSPGSITAPDNITKDFPSLFQSEFEEELEVINFLKENKF
jgi:hypothetical protein